MKKKLFLGLLAAAAVSFTACQKDEVISEMPQDQAIGFGTYVGRDAQTKASVTDKNAMEKNTYAGFGVFAYYTGANDYNSSTAPLFMYNQQVTYTTAWNYIPLKYWPGNNNQYKVSFFAYAPYGGITTLPASNTADDPIIGFTDPATLTGKTVSDQIDLLYATPVKNVFSGTVQFTFNHALTRIGFKVKTARDDYRVNISSIKLSGDFNTTGTLNLNGGEWSVTEEANLDTYELNFNPAATVYYNEEGTAINANEGYVMTIPTNFPSSSLSVSVTYTYEYEVSTGVWATPVSDTKTGTVTANFEKGKAYTLVMTLDPMNAIQFSVTDVTGWDENHTGFNPGTDVTIQ